METELAWRTAAALTGLLGGAVGAWFSVALPAGAGERAAPSGRRLAGFAAAGLLAGVWAGQLTPGPLGVLTSALGAALLLVAVVDGEHLWLPRVLTVPLGLAGIASALVIDTAEALDRIAGAAAGFAVLALLSWAYRALRGREGLGGGDAWLLGALGAWVGWMGLPSVLLWACAAGLSWAIARQASGRGMAMTDALPFGVFLAIGGWLTWLYGPLGLT